MKISIIIPTYGRPEVLETCLDSINLIKNEIPKPYEIIVVNNNKKKLLVETSKVVKKFKLNIKELKSKPLGGIGARNAGIKKAKGNIVIFFDDDTFIKKDYFHKLLKHYKNKKVGGVGGSEIKEKQSFLHKIFFKFNKTGDVTWSGDIISNFSPNLKNSIKVKHLHGSNFSIRKSVLKKIGFLDETYVGTYRDETDFIYRVHNLGFELVFEPKAKVIHTMVDVGGYVSPKKKKDWAYWYHRNTSLFFFKNLYSGNPLQLIAYLFREFVSSTMRAIIYNNIHYITQMSAIREGYNLNLKISKS